MSGANINKFPAATATLTGTLVYIIGVGQDTIKFESVS